MSNAGEWVQMVEDLRTEMEAAIEAAKQQAQAENAALREELMTLINPP